MMLHHFWFFGFLIALLSAVYTCLTGNTGVFAHMVQAIFSATALSVQIVIGLIGVMSFFMGMLHVGEQAGAIQYVSRWVYPLFRCLFPTLRKGDPVLGSMMMNFSANLLGLDNAATPFGIKAMQELQSQNPDKVTASPAQIMFVAMHSSGLTLIPASILAQRVVLGSQTPTAIFVPTLLTTAVATVTVVVLVGVRQRLPLWRKPLLFTLLGLGAVVGGLAWMPKAYVGQVARIGGNLLMLLVFFWFLCLAWRKQVHIYDHFVAGAKMGLQSALRILPYLVGMLVLVGLLRASGAFDIVLHVCRKLAAWMNVSVPYLDALPVAWMKPFSGAAARALMIDTMQQHGPDTRCKLYGAM